MSEHSGWVGISFLGIEEDTTRFSSNLIGAAVFGCTKCVIPLDLMCGFSYESRRRSRVDSRKYLIKLTLGYR